MSTPEGLKTMLRYRGFGPLEPIWEGRHLANGPWFSNEKDVVLAKSVASQGVDALYSCERAMTRYEASRRFRKQDEVLRAMRGICGFDPSTDEDYASYKAELWSDDGVFGRPCEGTKRDVLLVALLRRKYEKTPGVAQIVALRQYASRFGFDGIVFVTENGVTNPAKELCGCGPSTDETKVGEEKASSKKKKSKRNEDDSEDEEEEEEEPEPEPEEADAESKNGEEEEEEEIKVVEAIKDKVSTKVELVEYRDLEYDATENFFFPPFLLLNGEERIERLRHCLVDFHLRGSKARVEPSVAVSSRVEPLDQATAERRRILLARAWKELPRLLPLDPVCKLFALEEGDVIEVSENTMIGFEAERKLMIVCRTNNVEPRKT